MKPAKEFHLRVPHDVNAKLELLAQQRGIAKTWLILAAIEEFIGGGKEEKGDELRKELYEVKRRVTGLREDIEMLGELFSFYVYHWIAYTPRLERAERVSLAAEAKERHSRFMAMFVKKLKSGELSFGRALEQEDSPGEQRLVTGDEEDGEL